MAAIDRFATAIVDGAARGAGGCTSSGITRSQAAFVIRTFHVVGARATLDGSSTSIGGIAALEHFFFARGWLAATYVSLTVCSACIGGGTRAAIEGSFATIRNHPTVESELAAGGWRAAALFLDAPASACIRRCA